jgi:hypothetical protein
MVLVAFFIVVCLLAANAIRKGAVLLRLVRGLDDGVAAPGRVTRRFTTGGGLARQFHVEVAFIDPDGQPRTADVQLFWRSWVSTTVGRDVSVFHSRSAPQRAIIGPAATRWFFRLFGLLLMFVGAAILLVVAATLLTGRTGWLALILPPAIVEFVAGQGG